VEISSLSKALSMLNFSSKRAARKMYDISTQMMNLDGSCRADVEYVYTNPSGILDSIESKLVSSSNHPSKIQLLFVQLVSRNAPRMKFENHVVPPTRVDASCFVWNQYSVEGPIVWVMT
jgi:hypothetical protein